MVQADSGLVVSAVIRPVHPQQASLGWWRQELLRNGREKTKKNVIQIHFSRLSPFTLDRTHWSHQHG